MFFWRRVGISNIQNTFDKKENKMNLGRTNWDVKLTVTI
jgi:hypothetical protein